MIMGRHFNWPPFRLVALDADTGQPIDPNVGMRTYREFYDIKKDSHGNKVLIAQNSPSGSRTGAEDVKKSVNGGDKKNGNGGDKKGGNGKNGGGDEKKADGGEGEGKVMAELNPLLLTRRCC